jgi:predicted DNA-binding protein
MPHVVARARHVAYMRWTVMKYLQMLIAYDDYYFRQNTLEAVLVGDSMLHSRKPHI